MRHNVIVQTTIRPVFNTVSVNTGNIWRAVSDGIGIVRDSRMKPCVKHLEVVVRHGLTSQSQ